METNINKNLYECSHHKRGCDIYAKCCKKWYKCNICHDEKNTHKIDVNNIKRIKCLYCFKIQLPKQYCSNLNCNKCLGTYYCSKCVIYSNEHPKKMMFHCDKCEICLYGNKVLFKHCKTCDYCYENNVPHKCIENKIKNNCGICLDEMYKSQKSLTILICGHAIHSDCINNYIENVIYTSKKKKVYCPICRDIIINIDEYVDYNSDSETNIYNNSCGYTNLLRPISIRQNYIVLDNNNETENILTNIDRIAQEILDARMQFDIQNSINMILSNNVINMNNE